MSAKISPTKMSMSEALVAAEFAQVGDDRFHPEPFEQVPDRAFAQFRAGDTVAIVEQPVDVERLAAQRNENAATFRDGKGGKMRHQQRIGIALVKPDPAGFPAIMPETVFHSLPSSEKTAANSSGSRMAVASAFRPMANPENAPASSLVSSARAVPMPWLAVPMARPRARPSLTPDQGEEAAGRGRRRGCR